MTYGGGVAFPFFGVEIKRVQVAVNFALRGISLLLGPHAFAAEHPQRFAFQCRKKSKYRWDQKAVHNIKRKGSGQSGTDERFANSPCPINNNNNNNNNNNGSGIKATLKIHMTASPLDNI